MSEHEQEKEVFDLASGQQWDMRPYSFALEAKRLLAPLKDEGTGIDSGTMDGCADLFIKSGGVEFWLQVKIADTKAR